MARAVVAAVDLGAESGRVVRGELSADGIVLDERHRFANRPVSLPDRLAWDITGIFGAVLDGLRAVPDAQSIGVDCWGVDFALLRKDGSLTGLPRSYRDPLTAGILDALFDCIPAATLFARTGIQMMEINTLCQLLALRRAGSPELAGARHLLLLPDLLQHWLGADPVCERTNAGTTQMLGLDGTWAGDVIRACGLDPELLGPLVEAGTVIGRLDGRLAAASGSRPSLVAVASHDTASAVAAIPLQRDDAVFISSGTWSLVGMERDAPCRNDVALRYNLSNERGVDGTVQLLRNVAGLWLVQRLRHSLGAAAGGATPSYAELIALAEQAPPLRSVLDPDDPRFLREPDVAATAGSICRAAGEPVPQDTAALLRALLESLALRYRWCVDALRAATGAAPQVVHVVGGGSRNALLCRLTASATGLPVLAGPVEATATGNVLVQLVATGALDSVAEGRALLARTTPVVRYEPDGDARWDEAYARFCALPSVGGTPQLGCTTRSLPAKR
ncbi:MAG TPA: rhamnulokinase family protein [Candidatus Angelobacter sp.]|jgi:rhamnulokinase|nr:rhamnulokinase family protein [Candidatus Angelobacter sp.]